MAAAEKEPEKDSEEKGEGSSSGKSSETPWLSVAKEAGKQLVGVLLTGAGLLGFVAFAGAVIVWTRFQAVGVPGDQAVKAVSRDELVATGASLLLIFGFFGVLATFTAYLVDRGGRATPGMSRVLLVTIGLEGVAAIALAGEAPMESIAVGLGFLVLIGLAAIATFYEKLALYKDILPCRPGETKKALRGDNALFDLNGNPRFRLWLWPPLGVVAGAASLYFFALLFFGEGEHDDTTVALCAVVFLLATVGVLAWIGHCVGASRAKEKKELERAEAMARWWTRERSQRTARGRVGSAARALRDARKDLRKALCPPDDIPPAAPATDKKSEAERLARRRPHRLELQLLGVVVYVGLAVVAIAVPAVLLSHWWLAVSFAAAFVLGAGVWRLAVLTEARFVWYGLVMFVSIPLFGTLMLMARNVDTPLVQPIALIRATDGPGEAIQGIYVTEASDRVYFANVATESCSSDVIAGSGRLLWVPKKEVVAMSVGPLQDIESAGTSALEMSYSLTPGVETPTGALFEAKRAPEGDGDEGSGTPGAAEGIDAAAEAAEEAGPEAAAAEAVGPEATAADDAAAGEGDTGKAGDAGDDEDDGSGDDGEESQEEDPTDEHRLESAGPAVRPTFGRGLTLVPDEAEAGDVVELRMSRPENGGFGARPEGYTLRLNGVQLDVHRVAAQSAQRAEYVETEGGVVLQLRWAPRAVATEGKVRLRKDARAKTVDGAYALELNGDELAEENGEAQTVVLANGEPEALEPTLLRRAWSPTRIKFEVPEGAESGPITVECGQLAGQPVLTVVEPPKARLAVRMRPGSARVGLDSRSSRAGQEGTLVRSWKVAGRRFGDQEAIEPALPARLAPYKARLTVTDESGRADSVELRIFRLPASKFPLGDDRPASSADLKKVRKALGKALDQGTPQEIQLAGHADAVASDRFNVRLSRRRVERLRKAFFAFKGEEGSRRGGETHAPPRLKKLVNPGEPIPLVVTAFGESCPVIPSPGAQQANRRVEVFLLGQGAVVKPENGCRVARIRRMGW